MTNADVIYGIIAIVVLFVELLGILTAVHAVMNIWASIRNSVPGVIRMSKYFVPDLQILSALKLAALRGVDVRILLPEKADHRTVYLASFSYYLDRF